MEMYHQEVIINQERLNKEEINMKKFISLVSALSMALLVCVVPATASNSEIINLPNPDSVNSGELISIPVENAKYVKAWDGNIYDISDLPTMEDYYRMIETIENHKYDNIVLSSVMERATNSDKLVDSYSTMGATVSLRLSYSTSGNNNTGTITRHEPYTQLSGFTAFVSWKETYAKSWIVSGKDIKVEAKGEIIYNILNEGIIEVSRQPITLSGTVYAIR